MIGKEGPELVTQSYQTCGFCRYHDQRMQISGRNPIYDHYCKHPVSLENQRGYLKPESAWIGRSDRTPSWCPFLTGKVTEAVSKNEGGG